MSAHENTGSSKLFLWVWMWLLVMTGVEVFLAYIHLEPRLMFILLIGLSVIKAALIIAYFMHLRFDRLSLFLTLWPITVICLFLITLFFSPDSVRLHELRVF